MVTRIVSGLLIKGTKVLLCQRLNTAYYPDYWAMPAGHVEAGENFVDAIRRELFEELTVQLLSADNLATLYDYEESIEHQVFRVHDWRGEIKNGEPDRCAQIGWFELNQLPTPITPATAQVLSALRAEV